MAWTARFRADFTEWDDAIKQAQAGLRGFELSARQIQNRMQTMFEQFDGSKLKAQADIAAAAFDKFVKVQTEAGKSAKLSNEQTRALNATMKDAISTYERLGKEVPESWKRVEAATRGAADATDAAGLKTGGLFKTIAGGVAIGQLAANALTALGRSAVQMAKDFFASADALVSLSDKTGLSIEYLQKLQYAASQSGTSLDSMTSSITMMQDRLGSEDKGIVKAVKALGLSFDDLRKARPEQAFDQIVRALGALDDVNAKVAIASDIFGKAGAEVLTMASNYGTLIDKAEQLGLVMDEESIRKAEELGDQFETLTMQAKVLLAQALGPMVPVLIDLANFAAELAPAFGKTLAGAAAYLTERLLLLKAGMIDLVIKALELREAMLFFSPMTQTQMGQARFELGLLRLEYQELLKEVGRSQGARAEGIFGDYGPHLREAKEAAVSASGAFLNYASATEKAAKATKELVDWLREFRSQYELTVPNLGRFSTFQGGALIQPGVLELMGRETRLTPLGTPEAISGRWTGFAGQRTGVTPFDPFADSSPDSFWRKAFGSSEAFGGQLGKTILAAFTGGGNVGKSIGGFIGEGIFGQLGKGVGEWAGKLSSTLGKTLGGALGSIIPGLGTLLGGAVGSLFGKLFGGESKQTRQMRDQWLQQAGGIDEVRKMAEYAGVSIDRLLSTKKTKDFEREVKKLEAAFAAVQKRVQGLVTELGQVQAKGGLLSGDLANRLLKDFDKPEIQEAFKTFVTQNLTAATAGLQRFLEVSKNLPLTAKSAAAFGGALAGLFQRMRELGASSVEALKALQPAIDALVVRLKAAGLTGGAAFAELQAMAALATDEVAGPLLEGVDALTQAMVALSNAGLLTEDMFQGLAEQIGETWDKLIKEGKSGDQALRLMAPSLQRLWELQQKWGWEVDETTQALIDQAKEQGLVGEHMKDVMSQVLDVLKAIAKVLGADIPEAAKKASEAIDQIEVPEIPSPGGKVPSHPPPPEPYAMGGLVPRFLASGGWPTRGTDVVPAMLTPGEYVLSAPAVRQLGAATLDALNQGRLPSQGGDVVTLNVTIQALDTKSMREAVVNEVVPIITDVYRGNIRGARTGTRLALGVP